MAALVIAIGARKISATGQRLPAVDDAPIANIKREAKKNGRRRRIGSLGILQGERGRASVFGE